MRFSFILVPIVLVGLVARAQSTQKPKAHPHELNGFLLFQDRKAVEAALGKPFAEEKRTNGRLAAGYHLRGFKENYLVAFYVQDEKSYYKDKIVELELTGTEPSGPTGFSGLELGDSAQKAEAILGKPAEIRHEDDVNVDLWDYKSENYSLEFTPSHRLYSIQILADTKEVNPDLGAIAEVYSFAQAVKSRDINRIMSLASGEIECSQKEAFGIQTENARKILEDETSAVSVCLAQAADAILPLGPEMKSTDTSIRIWEKRPPGIVVKFFKESPLLEVVLVDEAGSPRIYEVTFR
jgi:hypothetical protein